MMIMMMVITMVVTIIHIYVMEPYVREMLCQILTHKIKKAMEMTGRMKSSINEHRARRLGPTHGRTDTTDYRDARKHLKMVLVLLFNHIYVICLIPI